MPGMHRLQPDVLSPQENLVTTPLSRAIVSRLPQRAGLFPCAGGSSGQVASLLDV